ncbi:MAG: penicillin-binding protein activator LpoB [Methylococcales symbiont of Iophon sp. n. MRB-2018]|nr:MAG: penicillin-binding protein activator LpoB [Methylococcales symbiont of Iophon sp. n. MRB-2018]KAF3980502.1 MAG: penicillin-binding protein activator LpoB [Methylococcales symbiont of Iophon sp. n. MRB-2018]
MSKCHLFFLSIFLLPNTLLAAEKVTILEVKGFGVTMSAAIQDGLIEAVKQTTGIEIDSQKEFIKKISETNVSTDQSNSHAVKIDTQSQNVVKEATNGLIREYRIIDSDEIKVGQWEVNLAVKMIRYKTPGIDPHSRRKIAVIPFQSTKPSFTLHGTSIHSSEISKQFAQKLVTELTQSRRFAVLDREHIKEFLAEKKLILSSDTPTSELMKIGEVLGVDYLLIGTISNVNQKQTPYTIQVTGETGTNYSVSFFADYRIIVMATRQIKWADSVALTIDDAGVQKMTSSLDANQIQQNLLGLAAKEIIQKAVANIYPLKVVKVQDNGEIVLNQGGVTISNGEELNIFHLGEQLVDPYTGESLGSYETWVATIKINRVIPKMSFGSVIKGDLASIKKGNICRRTINAKKISPHKQTGRTNVKNTANGGVILPFD